MKIRKLVRALDHSIRRSHPKGLVRNNPSPLMLTKKCKWSTKSYKTGAKTQRFNGYRRKTKCCAILKSRTSESHNSSGRTSSFARRMRPCMLMVLENLPFDSLSVGNLLTSKIDNLINLKSSETLTVSFSGIFLLQ